MPLELIVHRPGCGIRQRDRGCPCRPRVFDIHELEAARYACEGDSSRLELGQYTPPKHVDVIHVANSQAQRHKRTISD